MDAVIPVFGPDAIFRTGTRCPVEHGGFERNIQLAAKFLKHTGGIFQQFSGIENLRGLSQTDQVLLKVHQFFKSGVSQTGGFKLVDKGGQHIHRVANQQDIGGMLKEVQRRDNMGRSQESWADTLETKN